MDPARYAEDEFDVPWQALSNRLPVPDTSLLPDTEKSRPGAPSAHGHERDATVRGAAAADVPASRRDTRNAWFEDARCAVRRHPLSWLAAAFGLGLAFARVARVAGVSR